MPLNKQDARRIAAKLGAVVDRKKRAHDVAKIFEGGKLVATFGIRRGSRKDQGHDHIPTGIHQSRREAARIASCPKNRAEWIDDLRDKGLLDD